MSESICANPLRRLGAMLYDTLLCVAIVFVATLPFVPFAGQDQSLSGLSGPVLYAHRLWLLVVLVGFFGYCWTRKGRTLGMQAWHLRIETIEHARLVWRDVLARMVMASVPWLPAYIVLSLSASFAVPNLRTVGFALLALGPLNYLVAYFDPQRRAWHDRFLKTIISSSKVVPAV